MRVPLKWLSLALFGALVAVVAVPAFADDVVAFDAAQQVRIGSLVLEPGTYVIRSSSSKENRNVLTVWSRDEEKFFGHVLANYSFWSERIPEDQIVYDEKGDRIIRAWKVAWKGSTYTFSSAPVSTALASRGKAGSVVAAR